MSTTYDSIIFDLDGTLWDASATITRAFQAAEASVDYVRQDITQAALQAVTGQPFQVVYERLFPTLPPEHLEAFRAICTRHELRATQEHGGQVYPGVAATLDYLRTRYRLFIVSNCQVGYVEAFFQHSGLGQYFEGHQCFGTRMQPKFQNILDVVEQYDLHAAVYVGDTRGDLEASQQSGLPFIFASYGFGQLSAPEAPVRIGQFSDLRQLL